VRRASAVVAIALLSTSFAGTSPASLYFPRTVAKKLHCKAVVREGKKFRICSGRVLAGDKAVLLDSDVTLPGTGDGPFPLIVLLHGLGGSKESYESDSIAGTGGSFHFNNLWFASKGYAVLNYTARGFHEDKCVTETIDSVDARPTYPPSPACRPQLVHVKHEVKDTHYLVSKLVDGSLLDDRVGISAKKIGVAGVSYGGGHTWLLTRKNSWRSPGGTKIRIAAAVPIIGWTDLLDSLVPNGRATDEFVIDPQSASRIAEPVGVSKASYIDAFYALIGVSSAEPLEYAGYLTAWRDRVAAGEPYDDDVIADAVQSLLKGRSAYYVAKSGSFKSAIFAVNGFTDGIFPAIEALRMYNRLAKGNREYPIKIYLGDFGHPPAQNKTDEVTYVNGEINQWFDHYLKGKGPNPSGVVEARTTACAEDSPIGSLYRGSSWIDLQVEPVRNSLPITGDLDSAVTDPHADSLDPVGTSGPMNVCRVTDTTVATGNLAAQLILADGRTMMGMPKVEFDADPTAADMYVAARLWDVGPDGIQTLVTRGVYRLSSDAAVSASLKLWGNAYLFAPGHAMKLELSADDSPAHRSSNAIGTIAISNVSITMPKADPANLVGAQRR
jgi:dienelactone hydrolase